MSELKPPASERKRSYGAVVLAPVLTCAAIVTFYILHVSSHAANLREQYMKSVSHAAALMAKRVTAHAQLAEQRKQEQKSATSHRSEADRRRTGSAPDDCPQEMPPKYSRIVFKNELVTRISGAPKKTAGASDAPKETKGATDEASEGKGSEAATHDKCIFQELTQIMQELRLELVSPSDHPEVGDFDQAFLVDESMKVLAVHDRDGPLQARRLPSPGGDTSPESHSDGKDKGSAHQARPTAHAQVFLIELAGESYKAFLQPTIGVGKDSHIALVGLVSESRLAEQSRALDATTLSFAFLFLGLTLLAVPLAKLFMLGPHANYGKLDASQLSAAALFSALLMVVAGLTFYAHHRLDVRHTAQMKTTLDKVQNLLQTQVNAATKTLVDFETQHCWTPKALIPCIDAQAQAPSPIAAGNAPEPGPRCTTASKADDCPKAPCRPHRDVQLGCAHPCEFKSGIVSWCDFREYQYRLGQDSECSEAGSGAPEGYFKGAKTITRKELTGLETSDNPSNHDGPKLVGDYSILGIKDDGNVLYRLSSRPDNTAVPVSLGDRDYFQRARALDADSPKAEVALIPSHNTADYLLVAARPAKKMCDPLQEARVEVHSISINIPLLASELVMPESYTIALLKRDGETLYHSEFGQRSRHGYNFYESVGDDDALRAAIRARVEEDFETSYLGKPSRLVVRYLPDLDWYLVGTAPTVGLHGVVASCVWIAIVGCSLYLMAVAISFLFLHNLRKLLTGSSPSPPIPLLLRPQRRFYRFYYAGGAVMVAVSVAGVWGGTSLGWEAPIWWLFGLSLLAALVGCISRYPRLMSYLVDRQDAALHATQANRGIALGRGYACWVIGCIALLVWAPATILFANSYHSQMYLHASAALLHYAERLQPRGALEGLNTIGQGDGELARIVSQFLPSTNASESLIRVETQTHAATWAPRKEPPENQPPADAGAMSAASERAHRGGAQPSEDRAVRGRDPHDPLKDDPSADEESVWSSQSQRFLLLSAALQQLGLNDHRNGLLWRAKLDRASLNFKQVHGKVEMQVKDRADGSVYRASIPIERLLTDPVAHHFHWLVIGYAIALFAAWEVSRLGGRRLFFLSVQSRRAQPLTVHHVDDLVCDREKAWAETTLDQKLLLRQLAGDTLVFLPRTEPTLEKRWNDVLKSLEDHGWVRLDKKASNGLTSHCSINRYFAGHIRSRPMADLVLKERSLEQRLVLSELAGDTLPTPHPRWRPVLQKLADDLVVHGDHLTLDPALAEELGTGDSVVKPEERPPVEHSAWDLWRPTITALMVALWGLLGISEPDLLFGELIAPVLMGGVTMLSKLWLSEDENR